MSARLAIVLMAAVVLCCHLLLMRLADAQRSVPLPREVADVYEPERYATYLAYMAAHRRLGLVRRLIGLAALAVIVFTPTLAGIERLGAGNVYAITLLTFALFWCIGTTVRVACSYYDTFRIEERFGLNRRDTREFVRDTLAAEGTSLLLSVAGCVVVVFLCEHLDGWTAGFSLHPLAMLGVCVLVACLLGACALVAQLVGYVAFRRRYRFTPLPQGELRESIERLQEGSKRKVRQIYVYNESAKSTGKNAFLLRLPHRREFGIADNFLDDNSERELLAVLSHEVGHLKHRKNLLDVTEWALGLLVFLAVFLLFTHPAPVFAFCAWVNRSFGLSVNNYYLLVQTAVYLLMPLSFALRSFDLYRSRCNEYEADREAVRAGYGRELVSTFKRMSSDELVDVNPHPVVEALEYTHPGMYHRIRAIEREMEEEAAAEAAS
ncbi:MAG: M48 family metalloprotease [Coriobacteriales bacterium]